jgi:predicted AAA+ superfamily ATPase
MIELLEQSENKVQRVSTTFQRYLAKDINWNNRLIGIKGARGTGKTTLLLQWLKQQALPAAKAAYFSLDDLYFIHNTLVETAGNFYKQGGMVLVLDEVHKYPHWAREIKNLYDSYPDLKIIFTGSSILDIARQEGDLSRRALMYELPGLSFREYLIMNEIADIDILLLDEIVHHPDSIRSKFPASFRPYEFFDSYLKSGYYPFFIEDKEGYHHRLRQLIRLIVEYDMAELKGFDIRNAKKMLQLLHIIAQQVPFKPNLLKLAEKSHIHRNSISNYLHFLEEARLIKLLYPSGISVATLQKPEKIFLDNTNLLFAISLDGPLKGTLRETFFFSQLQVKESVSQPGTGDFEVNNKYIFEIGGVKKKYKQIAGLHNAFLVKDEIEYPAGGAFPLWLFGFLY